MNRKSIIKNILKECIPWIVALIIIIPFLIILFNSFKTESEALNMSLSLPTKLHWENFAKVWQVGRIPQTYLNSFIISTFSVLFSVFASSFCAFVIARNRTRFNKMIYGYFAIGLMVPVNMVTVVKVMKVFGLYNSILGIVLLFTALILPLSVFLFYGFIRGIPSEIDEAAIVEGASTWKLFFKIVFPMLKPVTVTVVMINFINTWNDFIVPLYLLPDPDKSVIVQQVYNFFGTFTASWNLVCVTILYAIVPILAIYLAGQKYIISGMVAGSVKG